MMWFSGSFDCGGGVDSMERSPCGDAFAVQIGSGWTQRRKFLWWTIGTNRSRLVNLAGIRSQTPCHGGHF
jgi:hypothetical protein